MIHLEPGHRVVGETIAARFNAAPDKREAVDVRAADLDDVQYHIQVQPEDRSVMHIHMWVRNFNEINEAVGDGYFKDLYPGMLTKPAKGYSISLAINLDTVPTDKMARDALARKLSSMKRDVVGAPLWICFGSMLSGARPPRQHYVVNYRPNECMYVIPQQDLVIVVYSICFENQVEQAIAKVFLQEIEVTRRTSKDLAVGPSVNFTEDPPHELKMIKGITPKTPKGTFIGFVSLAVSKRNIEGNGRLEKAVGLAEAYRSFLVFHIKATKSQMHTRIRTRCSNWLQVLNRAMPEKLNTEKKTITGRTFKR
jgi:actin related protein 2/3 complex subunit 2